MLSLWVKIIRNWWHAQEYLNYIKAVNFIGGGHFDKTTNPQGCIKFKLSFTSNLKMDLLSVPFSQINVRENRWGNQYHEWTIQRHSWQQMVAMQK